MIQQIVEDCVGEQKDALNNEVRPIIDSLQDCDSKTLIKALIDSSLS